METTAADGAEVKRQEIHTAMAADPEQEGLDSQLSVNKLILLYTIYEQENVKATDLFDYVLFRGYMDYFAMQNYMTELERAGLVVAVNQEGTVYYTLLPEGDSMIQMFRARIPHSIREEIRDYAKNSILNESPLLEVDAEIVQIKEKHYEVHCHVRDYDRSVLDFIKEAGTIEEANNIRNIWLQKGMSVYWNITKELT